MPPDDILARIARDFPGKRGSGVRRDVAAVMDRHGHRVARAILVLSGGDLDRLRHYARAADRDPRDVLYWAEYDRDDRRIRDCSRSFPPDEPEDRTAVPRSPEPDA